MSAEWINQTDVAQIEAERDAAVAALAEAQRERDGWERAAIDVKRLHDRMLPVLEAARAYRNRSPGGGYLAKAYSELVAAVDTYETQEGTDG